MKKSLFVLVIAVLFLGSCSTPNTQLPAMSSTSTKVPSTATITPTYSPTPIPQPPVISASNVMNLQEDFRIGQGAVTDAVWLPDGNVALVYSTGISIYDPDTGDLIKSVEPENKATGFSLISPDGKHVATFMYKDDKVLVWDAITGKIEYDLGVRCSAEFVGNAGGTFDQLIAFNNDGSQLAVCDEEGVSLWDMTSGDKINTFKIRRKERLSIAFNSQNNTLATSSSANIFTDIAIWDLATGEAVEKLPQISASLASNIRFNHQGNILAWTDRRDFFKGPRVTLYDINTNQSQIIYPGSFSVFEFSPDDKTLILGGVYGNGTRLLDIATGEFITEPNNNVADLIEYSPDGSRFVAGWDAYFIFRDAGGAVVKQLGNFLPYNQIAFDPNGRYLAAGNEAVTVWDLQTKNQAFDHIAATGHDFLFTPDGDGLITNALGGNNYWLDIQQWGLSTKNQQNFDESIADSFAVTKPLLFSPSGNLLAIGIPIDQPIPTFVWTPDGGATYIRFWDANSKEFLLDIKSPSLSDYEFSPDGKIFASSGGKTIYFWDLATQKPSKQFDCPENVYDIAFSPDGVLIAAAVFNGVYIWDTKSGELLDEIHEVRPVTQVAFSPQGNILAAIGYDKELHKILFAWDLSNNNLLYKITGDKDNYAYINDRDVWGLHDKAGVSFSPGGSFIVTAGLKRKGTNIEYVQFWDAVSGQLIKTLDYTVNFNLFSPYQSRYGFSPDGRLFAVADASIVHVMRVPASSDSGKEDILPTSIPIAQLPPLPTPTPEPAPAWDFNQNGDLEGWQVQNQLNPLQIRSGNLLTESTGSDPYMISPEIRLDASAYSHIEIRMKVSAGNTADLYFITNSEGVYDESKVLHFPITSNGQFQTYILDMSKVKKWSGKITQIRFDPTNAQADIEIDYIHILSSAMPTIAPAWDFNQNGDTEGWKAQNQLDPLQISTGSLITKSTGDDPFMLSSAIRLDASAFSDIEIRMKVSAGNTAGIYFITNSESGYDEAKALHYPITSDGQFHTYIFSMANVKKWSGEITQIRFDPTNYRADIEIDYIHILP